MKLTLKNLVDEIINQEHRCYLARNYVNETFGERSIQYEIWDSKLEALHNLAEKFNFVDKLKR